MSIRWVALATAAVSTAVLAGGAPALDTLGRWSARWEGRSEEITCSYRARTGLPCMGCGGTRALALAAAGDGVGALRTNVLGAWCGVMAWVTLAGSLVSLVSGRGRAVVVSLGVVLASGSLALLVNGWFWWMSLPPGARP